MVPVAFEQKVSTSAQRSCPPRCSGSALQAASRAPSTRPPSNASARFVASACSHVGPSAPVQPIWPAHLRVVPSSPSASELRALPRTGGGGPCHSRKSGSAKLNWFTVSSKINASQPSPNKPWFHQTPTTSPRQHSDRMEQASEEEKHT